MVRLSVSRLGLTAGSGQGGGGVTTDPNVNSIDADGWQINYTSPPAEFDPVGDPKYVVASRPGFNASGGSITVTDNLEIMKRVRQAYPNQASLTANNAAIADFVFSGDTITGVTNNSTKAYHKPICMWLDRDLVRVYDQSYTAKLAVAHWAARNGRPVAAVKFSATDGITTVESTVSSMTKTDYSASGLSVPHFEATLDLSTLDDDALITIDAEIFPWVGDGSFVASTDFAAYPSTNFCEMKVYNAVTSAEDAIYAYVDGVGAGTPQASTTEATAQANPYASVAAASTAIQTLDGANVSRGEVVIDAGVSVVHSDFSARVIGDTPLVIRGVNRATSIYQEPASSNSDGVPDKTVWKNLTIQKVHPNNVIFLDNAASGTIPNNLMDFVDVDFDLNGQAFTGYGAWVYKTGRCYCENSQVDIPQVFSRFSSVSKQVNSVGSSGTVLANAVYNAAGSKTLSTSLGGDPSAANREVVDGRFIGFNFVSNDNTGDNAYVDGRVIGAEGLAIVGNVFEKQVVGSAASLIVNADGDTNAAENVVMQLNTVIGQRTNLLYNDAAPYAVKHGQNRFNVHQKINTKADVFETDGTAVNNWSVIYKVGWCANAYLQGSSASDVYEPGSWMGEVGALGDDFGTESAPLVADWADDQSSDGGGAGDGDYRPGVSTALPQIPTGLSPYPFDQNGAAIANDGSAYAGALQP